MSIEQQCENIIAMYHADMAEHGKPTDAFYEKHNEFISQLVTEPSDIAVSLLVKCIKTHGIITPTKHCPALEKFIKVHEKAIVQIVTSKYS